MNKLLMVLFVMMVSMPAIVSAATINAASCSSADVQAAINSAVDGDTVSVPAGQCTWTGDVNIPSTKGIALIGAGIGNTVINLGNAYHLYLDTREANSPVRVSGFSFNNGPTQALRINYRHSGTHHFRIDHCEWNNNAAIIIFVGGWTFGVIDNCDFNNQVRAIFIEGRADDIDGGTAGGYSWSHPITMGGADAVYIEDCYANNNIAYPGQFIDSNAGGRYVVRYNTLDGWQGIETHSACTPSNAGYSYRNDRFVEIYGNTMNVNTVGTRWLGTWFRSSNGMAFNNVYSSGFSSTVVADMETICYTTCGGVWAKTQEQIDALTYPYQDQIGVGLDSGFGTPQATNEAKLWIFNNNRDGSFSTPAINFCPKATELVQHDRDYFLQVTPFDGSSGIGVGTLANRPSSGLANGVYYWATDSGSQGTLYRSTGATSWETFYTPYTYPHSFRADCANYPLLCDSGLPPPVVCTEADWSYSDGACEPSNTLTRTWTLVGVCSGGVSHPASEPVACTYVPIPGDLNLDGRIDISDLVIIATNFGRASGSAGWNANYDVVANGVIDIADLVFVARRYTG